jgi:hypothetical protein
MPKARPDTTVSPPALSAEAKARAFSTPCGVGLRLPTIAIPEAESSSARPAHTAAAAGRPSPAASGDTAGRPAESTGAELVASTSQPGDRGIGQRIDVRGHRASAPPWQRPTISLPGIDIGIEHPWGDPKAARSFRAGTRPMPGVSSRRSHAASSSRSIKMETYAGEIRVA